MSIVSANKEKKCLVKSGKVIQQNAVLKVNEKGAEAAAVTWAGMATSNGPVEEPEYIPFHVDRPFFFAIQENQNGNILFMGVVRNL